MHLHNYAVFPPHLRKALDHCTPGLGRTSSVQKFWHGVQPASPHLFNSATASRDKHPKIHYEKSKSQSYRPGVMSGASRISQPSHPHPPPSWNAFNAYLSCFFPDSRYILSIPTYVLIYIEVKRVPGIAVF